MPNWKKVIVSGSSAHLNQITASADINVSGNSLLDFNYSAQTVQGNVTASSAAHTIVVTVISKTSNHPYINLGSSSGYSLDGIESPWLNLTEGIYKFDVSHSSVGSHPFRFYFDAAKTQQYTANVDTSESGAVYLTVNKDTPQVLYYQCSSHGYMGFGLSTGMNPLVQDQNGLKTLVSASAQITHDDTTGFVANEHIDHSGVSISTGTGLTGGGDITSTRTLSVDFSDATFQASISGSFTDASSSFSTRTTTLESASGSFASDSGSNSTRLTTLESASGSFATDSGSFSERITNATASISALETDSGSFSTRVTKTETSHSENINQDVRTSASPTFAGGTISGDFTVGGTLTAQEIHTEFTSASILFSSGSTRFGDTIDDTHNMTGSLKISGSIDASTFSGVLSQSAQIADDISGSLGPNATLIRSLTAAGISGSLGTNAALIRSLTAAGISGSFLGSLSGSLNLISGSSISTGSFGKLLGDGSDITNLPSAAITSYSSTGDNRIITSVSATEVQGESNLTFDGTSLTLTGNMTASGDISGSSSSTGSFGLIQVGGGNFTSASLASGGSGTGFPFEGTAVISGSLLVSGSTTSIETLGNVSGSSTSTGSFGHLMHGGKNFLTAVSESAAASGFGTGTGGSFSATGISGSWQGVIGSGSLNSISGSSISTGSFGRVEATTFSGDGSGLSGIAAAIEVSEEGSSLTSAVSSINFVGDKITATNDGNDVTVTLSTTGTTGDAIVHNQSVASATWAVTHSLDNKYPAVTIWDDNDQVIIPATITADTVDTATITFEQPITGRATFTLGVPTGSYFISSSNQILDAVADGTVSGDLTVTGTVTAQEFHSEFVSSSILFTSGSTKFGDSIDDEHSMTGSLKISGSITTDSITADTFSGVFSGALSSSAQISDDISGSFTAASSSFSTRITTAETELSNTLISSSAQISDDISGSFTAASSSFSTRITTAETELDNTLVSSSAQLADEISGSLGPNASLIRSLTATTISGSFTAVSASISTRLDTLANDIIALSIALG